VGRSLSEFGGLVKGPLGTLSTCTQSDAAGGRKHLGMPISFSRPPAIEDRPPWLGPCGSLLVVAIPTAVLSILALSITSASVPGFDLGRSSAINYRWWTVGFLLVIPVFIVARAHPRLAAVAALIAGVPQLAVGVAYTARSAVALSATGGEEDFGFVVTQPMFSLVVYAQAAFMMLFFAIAAVCGTSARRRCSAPAERFFV
jgi:cation transport ATPase